MAILPKGPTITLKLFETKPLVKVKRKDQAYFLLTLYELLTEGFSLNQALSFMQILMPQYKEVFNNLVRILTQGIGLENGLRQAGFPLAIIAQLYYAQRQGRFTPALKKAAEHLKQGSEYRKRMVKLITYPLFMSLFLLGLLLGMRQFLLPHISSFISQDTYDQNLMVRVLINFFSYLPQILLIIVGLGLILYVFVDFYLLKQTPLKRSQILVNLPLARKWTRIYCTYKVALMVGYFLEGGYSLQQTFEFIVTYPIDPFLSDLSTAVHAHLIKGMPLTDALTQVAIFQPEFAMVIYQGELTSQLGLKAIRYAETLWVNLMEDVAKKMTYIQPILFIVIAVLVLSMYLLMMLPMLTMEGF